MNPARVVVTDAAAAVIERLRDQFGPLLFHHAGEGAQPMCYGAGEFRLGLADVRVGEIHGCPFYMAESHVADWQDLTIDVKPGRGPGFSLEVPLGLRFHLLVAEG
ncbi:DUF779 domain-containing protein [Luteolibacter sp. LG18]|uniref:DUF779 domain-containing protein n=1 Tax=Luteolibacter sp. LG18 TaxID=2819286 RepID=UPI002B295A04|nr:UDP-glucose 4-epimerase [Luteolibacter sp. LG18]